jgi:hypothetical protein
MKPSTLSNCEPDNDVQLMCETNNNFESDDECSSSNNSPLSISSLSSIEVFPLEDEPIVTLEDCSNAYFSGYLGKKCVDKFKCKFCEEIMLKDIEDTQFDNEEFLIFCKNYSSQTSSLLHLKRPTVCFTEFVSLAQKIIKKTVEKMPHKKNIYKFLSSKIKNDLSSILKFPSSCQLHFGFVITHLIHCKLLRDFNWISKNFKTNIKNKNKNKLNILQNK